MKRIVLLTVAAFVSCVGGSCEKELAYTGLNEISSDDRPLIIAPIQNGTIVILKPNSTARWTDYGATVEILGSAYIQTDSTRTHGNHVTIKVDSTELTMMHGVFDIESVREGEYNLFPGSWCGRLSVLKGNVKLKNRAVDTLIGYGGLWVGNNEVDPRISWFPEYQGELIDRSFGADRMLMGNLVDLLKYLYGADVQLEEERDRNYILTDFKINIRDSLAEQLTKLSVKYTFDFKYYAPSNTITIKSRY